MPVGIVVKAELDIQTIMKFLKDILLYFVEEQVKEYILHMYTKLIMDRLITDLNI